MADKTINQLTELQTPLDTDTIPIWSGANGNTMKIPLSKLKVGGEQIIATDLTVGTGVWTSSSVYSGYGYQASITISNITSDYSPDVRFTCEDAVSGIFAPVADCGTNNVIIYASEIPSASITIPVIICTKVA